MKILIFYQYFSTPRGAWGTRVYEFAKHWVSLGHEVTVVTSLYYKSDLKAERLIEDQAFEGIRVKVLNIPISNKQSFAKRVSSFLKFAVLSSWFAIRIKADVVIASSGPLTVGIPGLVARYVSRRRLVFEVRDLWPDVAIEIGALKNPLLKWAARQLEKRCYNAASLIVTLSPGKANHIKNNHGLKNTLSVPNAADNAFWTAHDPQWELPDWVQNKHIALYTGNIGAVNNSTLLFDAASELMRQKRDDIVVVLIGDGQERESLGARAKEMSLSTFRILGLMPKTELRHWVQRSMCALVPLLPNPILDTSSPNKLFDSLAAGVPVIQTTRGWIKDFVAENDCGLTVSAADANELACALMSLADSNERCSQMGRNAKHVAEASFDRELLSNRFLSALDEVVNGQA